MFYLKQHPWKCTKVEVWAVYVLIRLIFDCWLVILSTQACPAGFSGTTEQNNFVDSSNYSSWFVVTEEQHSKWSRPLTTDRPVVKSEKHELYPCVGYQTLPNNVRILLTPRWPQPLVPGRGRPLVEISKSELYPHMGYQTLSNNVRILSNSKTTSTTSPRTWSTTGQVV